MFFEGFLFLKGKSWKNSESLYLQCSQHAHSHTHTLPPPGKWEFKMYFLWELMSDSSFTKPAGAWVIQMHLEPRVRHTTGTLVLTGRPAGVWARVGHVNSVEVLLLVLCSSDMSFERAEGRGLDDGWLTE